LSCFDATVRVGLRRQVSSSIYNKEVVTSHEIDI